MAEKPKRNRGTGSVLLRGNTWWIQYCEFGEVHRESSGSDRKEDAESLLRKRLLAIEEGRYRKPVKYTVRDIVQRLFQKKENGELARAKSLKSDKERWTLHLEPVFGRVKAGHVTEDRLSAYVSARKVEKAAAGTINRELALLRRAFKIHHNIPCPKFPHLAEDNVRKGFLTDEQYTKLTVEAAKEGLWLRALLEVAATYGLRKGELLDLRVAQVDKATGRVWLEREQTKNGKARGFTLTATAKHLVFALLDGKKPTDHVFTRPDGKEVKDFRGSWDNICERAGVPGLLVHDLRRTAVRNMVRSGISDRVAMAISGHKTRSVFDRYNITSESDLDDAAAKMEQRKVTKSFDTISDTAAQQMVQSKNLSN